MARLQVEVRIVEGAGKVAVFDVAVFEGPEFVRAQCLHGVDRVIAADEHQGFGPDAHARRFVKGQRVERACVLPGHVGATTRGPKGLWKRTPGGFCGG